MKPQQLRRRQSATRPVLALCSGLMVALALTAPAGATDLGSAHPGPVHPERQFELAERQFELGFSDMDAVSDADLARSSGRADVFVGDIGLNIANNSSAVTGNSVDGNVNTGTIHENTLNDVSGINTLMYNTGNNVNFQSNTQINIFLK